MKRTPILLLTVSQLVFSGVFAAIPVANNKQINEKTGAPQVELPGTGAIVVAPATAFLPGSCGFRKAVAGLVKVYEICFFGKNMKATDWTKVFESPAGTEAYKLRLSFLRGVGGKKVAAALSEGLAKTPAAQKLEELERQKFLAWAAKLKIEKDSVMEFTFNDTRAFNVSFWEKASTAKPIETFTSEQKNLARAVAAIWLGDKPLNEDLRADLLKAPK